MSLYEIIKSLQAAQGSKAKQAILEANKDDELLKAFLKATYDPALSYYQKKAPKPTTAGPGCSPVHSQFDFMHIDHLISALAERTFTGDAAKRYLQDFVNNLEDDGRELTKLLIDRSVGAGVGDTMILKVWPDLYFTVPYQRCSLLDAKAKEKFSKLDVMIIQEKCDGSFLYLVKDYDKPPEAITRAGSKYPPEFAAKLAEGVPDNCVLIGELLVFTNPQYDGKMDVLPRQTGNGMLNSILKGGDVDSNFVYKMFAWDIVTIDEFKAGKSVRDYQNRLSALNVISMSNRVPHVEAIHTETVTNLEEAYKIYSKFTAAGLEGAVLKTPNFIWKDGTSKDCVKMKVEFEIDLQVIGIEEGTGKAAGMMGSLLVASSDRLLECSVGTGFPDDLRREYWNRLPNIITVKANDIISNRHYDSKSLFLPVFVDERLDKTVADTYEHCVAQLNAVKGL